MDDDPFNFAFNLARNERLKCYKYMSRDIRGLRPIVSDSASIRDRASNDTKFKTYCELNPLLEIHSVYSDETGINEFQRIAFTRFWVSARAGYEWKQAGGRGSKE